MLEKIALLTNDVDADLSLQYLTRNKFCPGWLEQRVQGICGPACSASLWWRFSSPSSSSSSRAAPSAAKDSELFFLIIFFFEQKAITLKQLTILGWDSGESYSHISFLCKPAFSERQTLIREGRGIPCVCVCWRKLLKFWFHDQTWGAFQK